MCCICTNILCLFVNCHEKKLIFCVISEICKFTCCVEFQVKPNKSLVFAIVIEGVIVDYVRISLNLKLISSITKTNFYLIFTWQLNWFFSFNF